MTLKPNLTRTWAAGAPGGNTVDPDTTTPGKFDAGWTAEVPPFEHFNFLQQLFTQGLAHASEQGIMSYDAVTDYPIGGMAKGSDGVPYVATAVNGPSSSAIDPVGDTTNTWMTFGVTSAGDMFGLVSIPAGARSSASMYGFFFTAPESNPKGGGSFVWQAALNKNLANGGTIIDPDNTGGYDGTVSTRDAFLAAQGGGVGAGCWVRIVTDGNISPFNFGAVGDGAADELAVINKIISLYPTNNVTVELSGEHTFLISGDLTFPTNILLRVCKGSSISIAATKTLTLNGGLDAGWYRIFTGSGAVAFGSSTIDRAKVSWSGQADFGAKVNELWGWGARRVEMPQGIFNYSTSIVVPPDNFQYSLFGQGHDATVLNYSGTDVGLDCEATSASTRAFAVLRDFSLRGTNVALHGITIDLGTRKVALERVSVAGFDRVGAVGVFVRSVIAGNGGTNILTFTDLNVTLCYIGVKMIGVNIMTVTGGVVETCDEACLETIDCKGISFFSSTIQSANTGASMVRISSLTRDSTGPFFYGCWFEEHLAANTIRISDTATYKITGVLFNGCEITNNSPSASGTYAIYVAGSGTAAKISVVSSKVRATNTGAGSGTGVYLAGATTRAYNREVEYQADINTGGTGVFA